MAELQDIHQLDTVFLSDLQYLDVLALKSKVRLSAYVFDLDVLLSCDDSLLRDSFASADLSQFTVVLPIRMAHVKFVRKIARKIIGTLI